MRYQIVCKLDESIDLSALLKNPNLLKLNLNKIKLKDEGVIKIAQVLPESNLKMIQIGMNALISAVPKSKLNSLDYFYNLCGDETLRALLNPDLNLEMLRLSGNANCSSNGLIEFIKEIKTLRNLKYLYPDEIDSGDSIAKEFCSEIPFFNLVKLTVNGFNQVV